MYIHNLRLPGIYEKINDNFYFKRSSFLIIRMEQSR